jgi:hypothetical protein
MRVANLISSWNTKDRETVLRITTIEHDKIITHLINIHTLTHLDTFTIRWRAFYFTFAKFLITKFGLISLRGNLQLWKKSTGDIIMC